MSDDRPPETQEEVVAAVLAELRRRMEATRRMAERTAGGPGPVGDAVRAVRDVLRGGAGDREDPGPNGPRGELPPGD